RKSLCRESCLPGFWDGSPACARPVPRVEVGPLRQPSPKAVAGRPRCATRGDFEVYVAEKSWLWRLRGLVKRGQEFIRVGKSLPLPFRRSTMGLKTRNRGPRRRLSGKDRLSFRHGPGGLAPGEEDSGSSRHPAKVGGCVSQGGRGQDSLDQV